MGIIDILKYFGTQKTIENFNKRYLLCRGDRISAVRPPRYKMYFDEYMERHVFVTNSASLISRSPKKGSFKRAGSSLRKSSSMLSKEDDEAVAVTTDIDDIGLEDKSSKEEDSNSTTIHSPDNVSLAVSPSPVRCEEEKEEGFGDSGVELMPV